MYTRDITQDNKTIYDKDNIIHNGKNLKAFLLKSGTRQGCPLSPFLFNIVFEVLARAVRKKKKERNPNQKGRNKTVSIMVLYIENPENSTKKLL